MNPRPESLGSSGARRAVMPLTRGDSVAFLDLDAAAVLAATPTRPHPQDVVISHDQTQVFVLEMGADGATGSLAVVSLARMEVVRRIELAPFRQPHWAVLSRDGRLLWVACGSDQAILEVDLIDDQVRHAWRVPDAGPWMFAVTPDEQTLVVAGFDSGTASVINLATGERRGLTLSGNPVAIAAAPEGGQVWIGAVGTDRIWVIDAASATVTAEFESAATGPVRMAFTPDGKQVVVTNGRGNAVTVYDAHTRALQLSVPTGEGSYPKGLALNAEGAVAYVSLMGAGRLLMLDVDSGEVLGEMPVGPSPERVALFASAHRGAGAGATESAL